MPLPRWNGMVPVIDGEHPELPPTWIPREKVPQPPADKSSNTSPSSAVLPGSTRSITHPLTLKGRFTCYISRNTAGEKHLDYPTPVPLIWGKYFILDTNDIYLGEGLTSQHSGGPFGTNDGEFTIIVENPYPLGLKIQIRPESHMIEVKPTPLWPLDHYDVFFIFNPVPYAPIPTQEVIMEINVDMNPANISLIHKGVWRIYETLTNDKDNRGAYYFLHDSSRGPHYNNIPITTAYYPYDPVGPFGDPPLYNAFVTNALFFINDDNTKALDIVQHEPKSSIKQG